MNSVRALFQPGIEGLDPASPLPLSSAGRAIDREPHNPPGLSLLRILAGLILLALLSAFLPAQTIEDGIMLSRNTLCTGALYTHDSWDRYWEGALSRENGNIGTVTTQSVSWAANYALTNRINFIGNVPYVWTNASKGILHGQSGIQDLTLAAKFNVLQAPVSQFGTFRLLAVVYTGLPLTNYTPDLQPLSIGLASKSISTRVTANYQGKVGLYLNGSMAYTWRGNVTLDRSSYYTNDQLYLSNQVAMPDLFNYIITAGYRKRDLMITGDFAQQQSRGGGDIRRQDMPFVSNRMNYSKAGVNLVWPVPKLRGLQYWFTYTNTFDGRNVGQANTFTTGFMYLIHFERGRSKP
jgi:hypothetical protein